MLKNIPSNQSIYSDDQWRFVYRLRCNGYRMTELSQWLDVSRETIRRNFDRLGLIVPQEYRPPLSIYTNDFVALGRQ